MGLPLRLTGVRVAATRTGVTGELNVTRASYFARVEGKSRTARAGLTSKTREV